MVKRRFNFLEGESQEERFDRLIGNRIGRSWSRPQKQYNTSGGRAERVRRAARGHVSVPSRVTREYRRGLSGPRTFTRSTVSDIWQDVYNNLTDEFLNNTGEQQAIEVAAEAAERAESEDRPWYQDLWDASGLDSFTGIGNEDGGFAESMVGRTLDVLSRPSYALFEGMERLASQETHTGFSPGDLWYSLQNFGSGLAAGITGEEKTGFGQVYEAYKENPTTAGGGFLREFEERHPNWEQALAVGTGLAGELALDPLNWALPAAPHIVRSTGEVATKDSLGRMVQNAANDAVHDFAGNSALLSGTYAKNPQALADRVMNSLGDQWGRSALEISGDFSGARGLKSMGRRNLPSVVSERVATEVQQQITAPFERRVTELIQHGNPSAVYAARVQRHINANPDYARFWNELTNDLVSSNVVPRNATIDDVLQALANGRVSEARIRRIQDSVLTRYEPEIQRIRDDMVTRVNNPTYRTLGIRIGPRGRVLPARAVGRAYSFLDTKLDNLFPNRGTFADSAFFESRFPSIFSVMATRARALGFNSMDEMREEIQRFARQFTPEQAIELQRMLEAGVTTTSNAKMNDALQFLRQHYDRMWGEEVAQGARGTLKWSGKGTGTRHGDDYSYIYMKGGNKNKREAFKAGRKASINEHGNPGIYTTQKAIDDGLKPIENAFENLFMRYVKSRRDMTRALFREDMVRNYSINLDKPVRPLNERALQARGLTPVSYNDLPQQFRQLVDASKGSKFYLPKPMQEIVDQFDEMTRWSTAEWNQFGRAFARAINATKAALTLPNIGFHVRNMIGDMFMGWMDGVPLSQYSRIAKKWALNEAGKTQHFDIVPGMRWSYDQMHDSYMRNADAGFFGTEFGTYNSLTAGSIPRRIARRGINAVRELSDKREFFARYVHYSHAYIEEARALWKKGIRDPQKIQEMAENAALWRVNYYKFDYSALMPWEKKVKTLGFPFYTYLRKALPMLLQQIVTNPHYLSTLNRFMEYNDGSAADSLNQRNIPQFVRDLGYAIFDEDSEEPWAMTADVFPLGAMDILSSSDVGEAAQQAVGQLNPFALAPIELATGQDVFYDRPLQGDLMDYIWNNTPMVGDINQEIVQPLTGQSDKSILEHILNERFTGLGLPVRQITQQQQQQQQQENRDRFIDDPLRAFNNSQDRYTISTTDQFTYRLRDQMTGDVIGEFPDPQMAIEAAMRLPGANYQAPFVNPNRPPSAQDVLNYLQGVNS